MSLSPSSSSDSSTYEISDEVPASFSSVILTSLCALLLSFILPSCGQFWLRCYRCAIVIIVSLVLCVGLFCWTDWIFEPQYGVYMLYCLGTLYVINLISAAVLGWQRAGQAKLTQQMIAVVPALVIGFVLLVKFKGIVFGAHVFYIPSKSMMPVLNVGDFVLVDPSRNGIEKINHGDIVVFVQQGDSEFYIKRVIAKPGDKLQAINGNLSVNGQRKFSNLNDLKETATTLDSSSFFVMGDNHQNSYDSRHWGLLERSQIIGVYHYTIGNLVAAPN